MNKEQILIEIEKYNGGQYVNYIAFIFLNLITNFKERFYSGAENVMPEIFAEMVTLSNSPNCSCRSKVIHYFQDNALKGLEYIKNWILKIPDENLNPEFFDFMFKEIETQDLKNKYFQNIDLKTKRMAGNVLIIEDTPEEYRKVINYLQSENFEYNDFNLFSLIDGDKKYLKFYFY